MSALACRADGEVADFDVVGHIDEKAMARSTAPAGIPMSPRADAAQNRERLVAAARTALATSEEVRLSAIARVAGVGQGTLYRRFPTREDLLAGRTSVWRELTTVSIARITSAIDHLL